LIVLNLRVYAQSHEATLHHLRIRNGDHEIDFIIERDDHKIVAMEVKLNATVNDSDVAYLAAPVGEDSARWLDPADPLPCTTIPER
jgi:predicted AAA+ superfamily ATPase